VSQQSLGSGPARFATEMVVLQFSKFVAVGASNTLISFVVYVGLLRIGVPYLGAGALAFMIGAINGYVLNSRWTFGAPDAWQPRVRYVFVQGCGLVLTSVLLWNLVSGAALGRVAAYALVIPIVTVATFAANRGWTFRTGTAGRARGGN
jgi:putative flippase GtrA